MRVNVFSYNVKKILDFCIQSELLLRTFECRDESWLWHHHVKLTSSLLQYLQSSARGGHCCCVRACGDTVSLFKLYLVGYMTTGFQTSKRLLTSNF